jgi:hypothetical protein
MLELIFSFDAPLETNRISSEDTQTRLGEFRQMPWIRPDYKAVILDALKKVERYWRRYSPSALRLQSRVSSIVTEPTDIAGVHRTDPAPPVF